MTALDAEPRAAGTDQAVFIRTIPAGDWASPELTPGWTLADHVTHLADWAAAIDRSRKDR